MYLGLPVNDLLHLGMDRTALVRLHIRSRSALPIGADNEVREEIRRVGVVRVIPAQQRLRRRNAARCSTGSRCQYRRRAWVARVSFTAPNSLTQQPDPKIQTSSRPCTP